MRWNRLSARLLPALAVVAALSACAHRPHPLATRVEPTPEFRADYEAAVACIGSEQLGSVRPFEEVRWWRVDAERLMVGGQPATGFTQGRDLVFRAGWIEVPWMRQHELAHFLLRTDGAGEAHPWDPFYRCGWYRS